MLFKKSRVVSVLKKKREYDNTIRRNQKEHLDNVRYQGIYVGRVIEEFGEVDKHLDNEHVECVVIEIPDRDIIKFERAKEDDYLQAYDFERISPNRYKVFIRTLDI